MQSISEKNADELSDTGQEQIGLNGSGTVRFTGIKREGILEDVNGSLNGDSVPVEVVPMVGVSGDAGIEVKVLVGIGVDTLAIRGIGTGMPVANRYMSVQLSLSIRTMLLSFRCRFAKA